MPPAQVLVDVLGFSLLPSPLAGEGLGMSGLMTQKEELALTLTLSHRERG